MRVAMLQVWRVLHEHPANLGVYRDGLEHEALFRFPGEEQTNATTLGSAAYWVEAAGPYSQSVTARSSPLLGGPVSFIASFTYPGSYPVPIGVTSTTVFLGGPTQSLLYSSPISTGVPASGLATEEQACYLLSSDTGAVYCSQQNCGSNMSIASDGTATALGTAVSSSYIVFDDIYAYWADMTTVGTIMRAPKAGGGTATVLARDTSPTAIAVDAASVYWSDVGGYIKSIPK